MAEKTSVEMQLTVYERFQKKTRSRFKRLTLLMLVRLFLEDKTVQDAVSVALDGLTRESNGANRRLMDLPTEDFVTYKDLASSLFPDRNLVCVTTSLASVYLSDLGVRRKVRFRIGAYIVELEEGDEQGLGYCQVDLTELVKT